MAENHNFDTNGPPWGVGGSENSELLQNRIQYGIINIKKRKRGGQNDNYKADRIEAILFHFVHRIEEPIFADVNCF